MNFNQFLKGLAIWLIPVVLVWLLVTPYYNLFLTTATNNVLRLSEIGNKTSVRRHDDHHLLINRTDLKLKTSTGHVGSVRVTDVQFNSLLMALLFLAVPGVPFKRRMQALGWAMLALVFFHIILLFFWVKFTLATQLGSWSSENFSSLWQNFWGLGKHLLDLPFKFAMPLVLWVVFFFDKIRPQPQPEP